MPRNRSMTASDWETAKVTRGMNMANNCSFNVVLHGPNVNDMLRVCDIINDLDNEYAVVRTWLNCATVIDQVELTPEETQVAIDGVCPWTADFYWRPEMTLAGHNIIIGKTRDDEGRLFVSIPYLCSLWGMRASGFEEEWGCCVDGYYTALEDGSCEYEDNWGEQCIFHMQNDPDDCWYHCLKEAISDGRCEGRLEVATALLEAYETETETS